MTANGLRITDEITRLKDFVLLTIIPEHNTGFSSKLKNHTAIISCQVDCGLAIKKEFNSLSSWYN